MRMLSDSQAIFQQLAETSGDQGVNVIIENHDAWVQQDEVGEALTAAVRLQLSRNSRDEVLLQRIARQRKTLSTLTTQLRGRASRAG